MSAERQQPRISSAQVDPSREQYPVIFKPGLCLQLILLSLRQRRAHLCRPKGAKLGLGSPARLRGGSVRARGASAEETRDERPRVSVGSDKRKQRRRSSLR